METSDYIVFLIGLAIIVGGIFQLLRRFLFLKSRCTARVGGNVLGSERNVRQNDDISSSSVSYYIKYHFFVDGFEYEKRRRVGKRQYKAIGKHDVLTVFYDPSKPKRHYVLQLKFRMLLTLSLIALGALLLYYPFYNGLL